MVADAEEIVRAVILAAKTGDLRAAALILDRLCVAPRDRAVSINLPDTSTAQGVQAAQGAIIDAVAEGRITPSEAATLAGLIEARRKAIETVDLENRVAQLEGNRQ